MPASKYDIYAEQGSTLKLHLQMKTRAGVPIDLSGFTGEMQVRRSVSDGQVVLQITDSTVMGGGQTGEFTLGSGVTGSGGILWGVGLTGATGATGCILVKVDATTMSNVPEGKHFYDLKVTNTLGEVQRLLEGMFEVPAQVSRTT
jgi:hypothetical protein